MTLLTNTTSPGPETAHFLPIFSFIISHHSGRMLHYNFVSALLNDLFGIQVRGGCMCAGPWTMNLLGLKPQQSKQFEDALVVQDEAFIRPGKPCYSVCLVHSQATFQV